MAPMSAGPYEVSVAVAAAVLLGVLLVGVGASRAKSRWTLLATGLVAILVAGIVLVAVADDPAGDDPGTEIAALYTVTVPLAVAFVAGWLAAKGSWLRRFVVVGVAALLLAAFPYAAAGQATAEALLP